MVRQDSFDPRRGSHFPTDLMFPGERDTLALRRRYGGDIGKEYYELWKVRKTFSLADFRAQVEQLPRGTVVRIVRIINNEHDINYYESLQEE